MRLWMRARAHTLTMSIEKKTIVRAAVDLPEGARKKKSGRIQIYIEITRNRISCAMCAMRLVCAASVIVWVMDK